MKALVLAAALLAGAAAPALAGGGGGGGGGGGEPGIHCEVTWGPMPEFTSEPLPVTLYGPAGMECH